MFTTAEFITKAFSSELYSSLPNGFGIPGLRIKHFCLFSCVNFSLYVSGICTGGADIIGQLLIKLLFMWVKAYVNEHAEHMTGGS